MTSVFQWLQVHLFNPLARFVANRDRGLKAETAFWDNWLRTKGDKWGSDYLYRISPESLVGEWHGRILDQMESEEITVLDVGAGPITSFGYLHKAKKLKILPVDPLACQYGKLIEKYGVIPPVKTVACSGEELHTCFHNEQFDLVNARNSLDHAVDPLQCIGAMYMVCRFKGYLTLIHAENEAVNNRYLGLHQWNFSLINGELHIQGDRYIKSIDNEFSGRILWQHEISGGIIYSSGQKIG